MPQRTSYLGQSVWLKMGQADTDHITSIKQEPREDSASLNLAEINQELKDLFRSIFLIEISVESNSVLISNTYQCGSSQEYNLMLFDCQRQNISEDFNR